MIQEKLVVLRDSNTIDESVYEYAQATISILKNNNIIKEDDEADGFITHLAMATERQRKGEAVDPMDSLVAEQIELDPNAKQAKQQWAEIVELSPVLFHENELNFLYLHIITLLSNR
ncbi:PRD domain-containing protein [Bacillus mycoides]|uniref:PRD domain-containing protein n=1 Tax=Bacillus mycoides TaxID=1405 RepID=UPI00103C3FA1|nr:PRD domain-containing protein [Bacillus mycoides]TBX72074.1 PRD domain-containing protein [Bacillus mycoides]